MEDKNTAIQPIEERTTAVILGTRRGRGRPPKHGVYSKYVLAPLTDNKYKEIQELARGERLHIAPSDHIIVNLLARILAQVELMGRYLSEHGLFQDDVEGKGRGTLSPMVPQYTKSIEQASKLLGQLGLTPESRLRLTKGLAITEDLATKIQRARDN